MNSFKRIFKIFAKAKNSLGITPIMFATASLDVEEVKTLIAAGADVNARDNDGLTVLEHAVQGLQVKDPSAVDCVKVLIASGAHVNARFKMFEQTPLIYAAECGLTELCKVLIDAGADVNATDTGGNTALIRAAQSGHTDCVKVLISGGADLNIEEEHGLTAMMIAKKGSNIASLLRNAGARSDSVKIDTEVKAKWDPILKRVKAMADQEVDDIHDAVRQNDLERIEKLLRVDHALANMKNNEGKTPLHIAAYHDGASVRLLLAVGADVNASDSEGRTPLHHAALAGEADGRIVASILLTNGANIHAVNSRGKTPLDTAVEYEHAYEVAEYLRKQRDPDGTIRRTKSSYHRRH